MLEFFVPGNGFFRIATPPYEQGVPGEQGERDGFLRCVVITSGFIFLSSTIALLSGGAGVNLFYFSDPTMRGEAAESQTPAKRSFSAVRPHDALYEPVAQHVLQEIVYFPSRSSFTLVVRHGVVSCADPAYLARATRHLLPHVDSLFVTAPRCFTRINSGVGSM